LHDLNESISVGAFSMADERPDSPIPSVTPPASSTAPGANPAGEPQSKDVLKAAFKAFKKRWKLTQLDQESRIGRGPMSSGQKSSIVGIQPPDQFPAAVWEALVEDGRLKRAGRGQYSLA
jgi:hypothetical protein